MLQFYNTTRGEIAIDGERIETLDTAWLRNNITLVQQRTVLFNETIFKNVTLGHANHEAIRKTEVMECIQFAALGTTITQLPHGLDTLVGRGGSSMSGGQRQRVAIARARLRNTPVLILDEVTNALDHTNMKKIIQSLREWRKNKTTIIITHDVSQVLKDDYVYVLGKGQVVQEGYRRTLDEITGGPFSNLLDPKDNLVAGRTGLQTRTRGKREVSPFPKLFHTFPPNCRGTEDKWEMWASHPPPKPPPKDTFYDSKASTRYPPKPPPKDVDGGVQLQTRHPPKPSKALPLAPNIPTQHKSQNLTASLEPANAHLSRMSNARMSIHPLITYSTQQEQSAASLGISPIEAEMPPITDISLSAQQEPMRVSTDSSLASSIGDSSYDSNFSDTDLPREDDHVVSREFLSRPQSSPGPGQTLPLKKILGTVWPNITWKKRLALILGSCFALVHAAATPLFSWVFSRLLGTFFGPLETRARMSLMWSMAVLGIAIVDAIASYFMHLLLEIASQAWVDSLRTKAFRHIIDQPQSWFDAEKNSVQEFAECLDRDAEEMRNLVGRFGGFILVAIFMMLLAFVWCVIVCWKLTLVGVGTAPLVYGITRGFETVSGRWERICNDVSDTAGAIFAETFGNIQTVRAFTLEGYFHQKYAKATTRAMRAGMKRAVVSGLLFGISDASLVFVIGAYFALSSFSC